MADIAASNVTYTIETERRGGVRPNHQNVVKVVFGNGTLTYPSGGVPLTATKLGLPESVIESLQIIDADDSTGVVWKYDFVNNKLRGYDRSPTQYTGTIDDNDSAATLGHTLYVVPVAAGAQVAIPEVEGSAAGLIQDSDTAAADGVAIYVVVDDPSFHATYQLGHLEFVSPTNANGTCTIANGGATLTLFDDDAAATNGVAVRAVAAGGGLEATTAAAKDILVPVSTGKFIHINHATTGSTPELYFDEDAANTYERIQGVIVDNADEPYSLFVTADEEAPRRPSRAGLRLAQIVTSGPKPFTYTVGSGGPEITVEARPDVATCVGASLLFAQAAGAGFNSANFGKEDVYVAAAGGAFVKVSYAASPAGVQCYGYPEGATNDLTILGVIVDNADETFLSDVGLSLQGGSLVELASAVSTPASQTLYVNVVGY